MSTLPEIIRIPMRDGVFLSALLYRQDSAATVLLQMTPYIADRYHPQAQSLAKRGYAVVIADVRGRGDSGGDFDPFVQEATDTPDAIDWLAGQSWCNGDVCTWGGSYSGTNQWTATRAKPKALKAIAPIAAAYVGRDFPARNGIYMTYLLRWLTVTGGRSGNWAQFADRELWADIYRRLYSEGHAFNTLDTLAGRPTPVFQRWMQADWLPEAKALLNPTSEELRDLSLPVLTLTGHYDGDQPGALEHYRRHLGANPQANHYLVIGPWDHAATGAPRGNIGGVEVGDASLIDVYALIADWLDWQLRGADKPAFLANKVNWFVTGANCWRSAASLEQIAHKNLTLFLSGNGPCTAAQPGELDEAPPHAAGTFEFVDDPRKLDAMIARDIAQEGQRDLNFAVWHEDVEALNGDGLVFDSEPLGENTEITGCPDLELHLSVDTPDVDVRVRLYEMCSDGQAIKLTEDYMRLRHRNGLDTSELATPGEIYSLHFEQFMFFSRQVAKTSRLRLVIDANNTLEWQQNYNDGSEVNTATAEQAKIATVRLHHSPDTPCKISLPIAD